MNIFYKHLFIMLLLISSLDALETRIIDEFSLLTTNEKKSLHLLLVNELEKNNNKIVVYISSKIQSSNIEELRQELLNSFQKRDENITLFFINQEKSQIWTTPDDYLIDESTKKLIVKNLRNKQIYKAILLGSQSISKSFGNKTIQKQEKSEKSLFQYFDPHFLAFLLTLVLLVIVQSKMEGNKKE